MEEYKDGEYAWVWIACEIAALFFWLLLIFLKAYGVVDMHWALVLGGIVWISWAVFALAAMAGAIVWLLAKLKRYRRRKKSDRRIIRQAKAAGAWGNANTLGGRALELHVWEWAGIKRQYGETDAELRRRYKEIIKGRGTRK